MKAFIAILVLLIIGGLVYYAYNSSYKKTPNTLNKTNTTTKTVPNSVSIENMSFQPGTLTVKAGTEVTWTNNDTLNHTITSDTTAFQSGDVNPGSSFKHVFSTAGTYPYHCSIHPSMQAKIVVQ